MMEKLYIVIPCYNEEEVLDKTKTELKKKMNTQFHLVQKQFQQFHIRLNM